jgi:hypothetical protein
MTIPDVERELKLAIEHGDTERAEYVQNFLDELDADFNDCETPDL